MSETCSWCEEKEPTTYCKDCKKYYCGECDSDYHKKGKAKEHTRAKIIASGWKGEKSFISRMCPTHKNNPIETFCENEKKLCCFECAFQESGNGHKVTRIGEIDNSVLNDSNKILEELKKTVDSGKKMSDDLDKELEKINENSAEIQNKIKTVCDAMRKEIDRIEETHLKSLEDEIKKTTDLVIARATKLKGTIEPIETFIKGVESKENGDDVYVNLWNIAEMTSAKKELEAIETERLENIHFTYDVDVESEKGKLKSLIDSLVSTSDVISLNFAEKYTQLKFDKLSGTSNSTAEIPTGDNSTHDGGSIFDAVKRIIVSVSGNYNNGKNLKVSKLGSDMNNIKGETRLITDVIPFNTHGNYPVYDGEKWIYFFESESGSYNRFGRMDIDNLDSKDFKELPRLPSGRFEEYSSSVYHFGSIYSVSNNGYKLYRFIISENKWVELSVKMSNKARLLSDGVREDILYALVAGSSSFYEINLKTNTVSSRASNSTSYNLGANHEAYLLRTAPDDFIAITSFGNEWYAYTYKSNKWVKLSNWGSVTDSAHFFFDPVTLHGFYHIQGRSKWEKVDMRSIKI